MKSFKLTITATYRHFIGGRFVDGEQITEKVNIQAPSADSITRDKLQHAAYSWRSLRIDEMTEPVEGSHDNPNVEEMFS